ncbi:hypothetical protein [Pseudodesulfovibrio profundus]|uniref:hypothetical protein n=1 Tax=Pseudodesulfovibrio profundus TaxID=57320 RepID=UPI000BE45B3C|nr:hypothetical protein [Pseudodesulfovibrio profundus]
MAAMKKKRLCAVCKKEFLPNSGVQIVCSDICKSIRIRDQYRKKRGTKVYNRECIICGKPFETAREKQITCGSEDCQKEHLRHLSLENNRKARQRREEVRKHRKNIPWNIPATADPFKNFELHCQGFVPDAAICPLG